MGRVKKQNKRGFREGSLEDEERRRREGMMGGMRNVGREKK